MCWKSIVGSLHVSTRPAVNCEVCKAIEVLGLDSSAHDLWACTDERKGDHGFRRKFTSVHATGRKSEKRAAGSFRLRLLELLPRH